jgi:hypothetical protein
VQHGAGSFVHGDGARLAGLGLRHEDGIGFPIDMNPLGSQSLTDSQALPTQDRRDRLDMWSVGCDEPIRLLLGQVTDAFIRDLLAYASSLQDRE